MNYWKAFFCTVLYMGLFTAVLVAGDLQPSWPPLSIMGLAVFVGFAHCYNPKEDRE